MVAEIELTDRGDEKRRNGELWLYPEDVQSDSTLKNGAVVDLIHEGSFRGRAFYDSESAVRVRLVSTSKTEVDRTFFKHRIQEAINHRERVYPSRLSYRIINAEGDYIPGLIVDKFNDFLVVQFRHPSIEDKRSAILDVLEAELDPRGIYARNDTKQRERCGLDQHRGLLRGDPVPETVCVQRDPFTIRTDLKQGQKTGFYLDQVENRKQFGRLVGGEFGVDVFCYSGSWGLEAIHRGVSTVLFVDQSETAIEMVRENARINGWSDRIETVKTDAFDFLRDFQSQDRETDFMVLDPPSFAFDKSQRNNALKGYKEINLRAMQSLKPLGLLATNSCSTPVKENHFRDVLIESSHDAHVRCRILEERGQPMDHPWLPRIPSTRYLNSILAEVSLR